MSKEFWYGGTNDPVPCKHCLNWADVEIGGVGFCEQCLDKTLKPHSVIIRGNLTKPLKRRHPFERFIKQSNKLKESK